MSENARAAADLLMWDTIATPYSFAGRHYLMLKRLLDIILAVALLLLFSLVMLLIAIAIKLCSPGPVLFRQRRVGKDGREFTFLKFRSMRDGADQAVHREHVARQIVENAAPGCGQVLTTLKLAGDPRITGLGRVLRRTSLDELPQLFNVLRGEMSLVGPRPPIPYEVELYQDWHYARLAVLPGITGLWQVEGRNRVPFDDMVRIDIDYIRHMSLGLDLSIMLRTPLAMLGGGRERDDGCSHCCFV